MGLYNLHMYNVLINVSVTFNEDCNGRKLH